jgi:hypothetical protein
MALTQSVPLDYLAAIQAVAALEDRIREYQQYADRGADVAFVVTDAHRAVVAIREAFRIERPAPRDDTTPQLLQYQAEGR